MYKLKMGDIVFMFSTELDALIAQLILLMFMENKFSDEDILNSRVVRNSRLHLPGSENL